ncbi:hypothetical protein OG235_07375 [Streptomyces sp. NBC_00024]|uniref:hypothetical protein n=1 Tax=Streptomyces sp. NBC_00024 TaxID=2903612 RepID=UPI00324A8DB5
MSAPTVPLAFLRVGVQSSPRTHIKRTTPLRPVPAQTSTRTGRSFEHPADPHVRVGDLLTEAPADSIHDDPARESSRLAVKCALPSSGFYGRRRIGKSFLLRRGFADHTDVTSAAGEGDDARGLVARSVVVSRDGMRTGERTQVAPEPFEFIVLNRRDR